MKRIIWEKRALKRIESEKDAHHDGDSTPATECERSNFVDSLFTGIATFSSIGGGDDDADVDESSASASERPPLVAGDRGSDLTVQITGDESIGDEGDDDAEESPPPGAALPLVMISWARAAASPPSVELHVAVSPSSSEGYVRWVHIRAEATFYSKIAHM